MNIPEILSHAYLISGGSEESRDAFALRMTEAYLCEQENAPCGRCRSCRKVAGKSHPDVTYVSPVEGKQEISVEQIRTLRSDVYIRPNEGKRKVYVIRPADSMNSAAQNALLKVLEDGPAYAAFLLLTGAPGQLLDTVRSRCEALVLPPEEDAADPKKLEKARALARLLLEGDELSVAEALVALELEKPNAASLAELLLLVEQWVTPHLSEYPRRGVRLLTVLKQCRDNNVYHPGPGHTLGRLMAELFR